MGAARAGIQVGIMMYKLLITTNYSGCIHTLVVEFNSREEAETAFSRVNNSKVSYYQKAIALY